MCNENGGGDDGDAANESTIVLTVSLILEGGWKLDLMVWKC
jgi:hypothetical protein